MTLVFNEASATIGFIWSDEGQLHLSQHASYQYRTQRGKTNGSSVAQMCLQENVPLVIYGWIKSFTESQWSQRAITSLENLFSFLISTGISIYSSYIAFIECLPQRKSCFVQTHNSKEVSGGSFLQNISHWKIRMKWKIGMCSV